MPLTEQVPQWKEEEIEEIKNLVDEYKSVGIIDMQGIPARQLQQIRSNLRDSAVVRMGRNTLIKRALESKGSDKVADSIKGEVGLIFTNDDPFSLYRKLQEGKSPAPLKKGQKAPNDIVIPEGDTGEDPGPFLGDLQEIGADARIDQGSIVVASDSTVLKEGEIADSKIAEVLDKLEIYPVEVGLDLILLQEGDTIFEGEELDIDIEKYQTKIQNASTQAFNLAINANIPTPETIDSLLSKTTGEAINLGIEAEIYEEKIIEKLLAKANNRAKDLAPNLDKKALPEDLKEATQQKQKEESEQQDQPEQEKQKEESEQQDQPEQEKQKGSDEDETEEKAGEGLSEMF